MSTGVPSSPAPVFQGQPDPSQQPGWVDVDKLISSANAAPALDPAIHVGIAQTAATPAEAAQTAQTVAGFGANVTIANQIAGLSPKAQEQAWSGMTSDQQAAARAAGYPGPPKPKSGGLFGNVLGDVTGALASGEHTVSHAIGTGVHDTLNVLNAPLRAASHIERAARLVGESGMTPQQQKYYATAGNADFGNPQYYQTAAASFKNVFSAHEWAQAWDKSSNGEKTFEPYAVRQVTQQLGQDKAVLAQQIASTADGRGNLDLTKLSGGAQIKQQLAADPDLASAVKFLSQAKMSPGRAIVGEKFTHDHPGPAQAASGLADAAIDWYSDPLNKGVEGVHEEYLMPYVVGSPADVVRLANADPAVGKVYPQVQNALDEVDGLLKQHVTLPDGSEGVGNVAGLAKRFPSLAKSVDSLGQGIADGTYTANRQGFVDWLTDTENFKAIMGGGGLPMSRVGTTMLRAGPLSDLTFAAKNSLEKTVDYMKSVPVVGGPFRSIDRASILVPKASSFDPMADGATKIVGQVARMFMPEAMAQQAENAFALAPDLSAKRTVYQGVLRGIGDAAGLNDNAAVRDYWSKFVDNAARMVDPANAADNPPRVYSGTGDVINVGGQDIHSGVLANQVQGRWGIPDYKILRASMLKTTLGDSLMATVNSDGIDFLMQRAWKPMQLLRLGFAPRVAMEELFGALVRDGATGLARSRLAASSLEGSNPILPWHPMQSIFTSLAGHLPEGTLSDILTGNNPARELFAQVVGDNARSALRNVEGRLAGDEYVNAARQAFDQGVGERAFASQVSALHHDGGPFLEGPDAQYRSARQGAEGRRVYFAKSGDWTNYSPGTELYHQVYSKALNEIAFDPLGREALKTMDAGREAQVQAVMDKIESPEMARTRAGAFRYHYVPDVPGGPARVVGVDATQEEATRAWANKVVDHVNGYLTSPDGTPVTLATGNTVHSFMQDWNFNRAPDARTLSEVDSSTLPLAIHGPEYLPVSTQGQVGQLVQRGFREWVGRPMDWMARQPMFIHNLAISNRELQDYRAALEAVDGPSEHIDQLVNDVAVHRAVDKTVPFIHDPQIRSQFAVSTRNLMPFEFAQEQFYKRWARTFSYAPDAFRRAMLISQGVQHSGITYTDPTNGQTYLNYPIIGEAQRAVLSGVNTLMGHEMFAPVTPGFAGDVKYMTPGLERLGAPSFGPLVSVPLKGLTKVFPELAPVDQALEGQQGAGTPLWQQFMPSTVAHLYEALGPQDELMQHYGSAYLQAVQYLEATGHGLPENATVAEQEQFKQRVLNWTRISALTRAALGFAGPTAPLVKGGPSNLPDEYNRLIKLEGINQAHADFIKANPDATPYTVFGSQSTGKADLPAAQSTLEFMDANAGFLKKYPLAAGWLLPQPNANEGFSSAAYREQLAMGMRVKKSPGQMVNDVVFAKDAPAYYEMKDKVDAAKLANPGNTQIAQAWSAWQSDYLNSHPVFAQVLQDSTAKAQRAQIMTDLASALSDPSLPQTPQTAVVSQLVTMYQDVAAAKQRLAGQHNAAANQQAKQVEDAFAQWAAEFATENPSLSGLYDRLIRPDLGGTVASQQIVSANLAMDSAA